MIELYTRPVGESLIALPSFRGAVSELAQGKIYRTECTRLTPRSGSYNRYVHGVLMRYLHSFRSSELPYDAFRHWVTIGAGYFHTSPNGMLLPRSWAYGNMDQDQFRDMTSRIIDYAIRKVIPDSVNAEDVNEAIENLLAI